jgi:transposase
MPFLSESERMRYAEEDQSRAEGSGRPDVQEHQQDYPSQTAAAQAVARQLGLGRETVRRWVVSAEIDAGGRPGATSAELAEIKTLKAKVRRLEEDNAILRSATVFFAGELDPRNR